MAESQRGSTQDEQRQLRALLYALTPVDMLHVVIEVIGRQRENERKQSKSK